MSETRNRIANIGNASTPETCRKGGIIGGKRSYDVMVQQGKRPPRLTIEERSFICLQCGKYQIEGQGARRSRKRQFCKGTNCRNIYYNQTKQHDVDVKPCAIEPNMTVVLIDKQLKNV